MIIICNENSDHEIMCVYALEMGVAATSTQIISTATMQVEPLFTYLSATLLWPSQQL